MGLIDKPLPDSTAQMLEYAETGRLLPGRNEESASSLITLTIIAGGAIGAGTALVLLGMFAFGAALAVLAGALLVVAGLATLPPAVRLLREAMSTVIPVRPGAVLPPGLVKEGCWIHRSGGWVRVEQIGRDGTGTITALVSTGKVIELRTPVTIAGDAFRPIRDPMASLRN
jgi:hypothetical protein